MQYARQQGMTLIEMMFALVIVAMVLGIAILVWSETYSSANAYKVEAGFDGLLGGIRSVYLQPQYASITTTSVIASAKVPADMVSTSTQIVSPWGAQVHIAPTALNGPAGSAFVITFDAVPSDQCTPLVQHAAPQVNKVEIGTVVVKDTSASPAVLDPPPDTVVQACLGAAGQAIAFTST